MMFFLLFGLSLAAVAPSDGQEMKLLRGDCPMFWYNFDGRCYKYVATDMTWADAEQHCLSQGANLVSIHSLDEENFVKRLIRNFDPAQAPNWIGLSDAQKDGTFFWSDGSKLSFTFWEEGEPNDFEGPEPCVHTNSGPAKKWNDAPCTDKFAFVCKARPAC
ncbi:lactose-binding lectin l-2-like [Fundulus heteroclitus]|uniref:lactose-binding lectin l-2-like n=1 Tax=Fundulus heteroclitus TaxID=8078 RepID=UPI00165C1BF5|nr:lactose-binding lectin l-2-like [Fundulus heteroclitus]